MRTYLPLLPALLLLYGCDGGTMSTHSHDNISGVREGVWPPEPIDMENAQLLPAQLRPRARQSVVEIARRSVMNNPELQEAIGDNYGTFDASLSTSKSDTVASFIFYNYDTNQTIEAILGSDGTVTVSPQPANQWQPSENAMEVEQAIELARNSLTANDMSLDTLKGTAMLTYPTVDSNGNSTQDFFDTRVLYVTFGMGDGEPPIYSARVDLSSGVVSEGGPL